MVLIVISSDAVSFILDQRNMATQTTLSEVLVLWQPLGEPVGGHLACRQVCRRRNSLAE